MPLVVEDGTGTSGADSYLSLDDFATYCTNYGHNTGSATNEAKEVALRKATAYIDGFRYRSLRLTESQALEFPRAGLVDWNGLAVTGVPLRVKNACAELAVRALTTTLDKDQDRGGMVKSKSVGPISVTYSDKAPAGTVFTAVEKLLQPYFYAADQMTGPGFTGSDPIFSVGEDSFGRELP